MKFLAVPGDGRHAVGHPRRPGRRRRPAAPRCPTATASTRRAASSPGPTASSPTARSSRSAGCGRWPGCSTALRRFVDDDGEPTILGFHAVGDAHTCTNPLYGRGLLARLRAGGAARRRPRRAPRRRRRPRPRLRGGVPARDRAVVRDGRCRWTTPAPTRPPPAGTAPTSRRARPWPRCSSPPPPSRCIGRALARLWNLLATPADLMADGAVPRQGRRVVAEPDKYPSAAAGGPEPPGPARGADRDRSRPCLRSASTTASCCTSG